MDIKDWKTRITQRSDFTCGLIHLTKPKNGMSSLEVLIKILKERTLSASTTGFICGDNPVVCFQDVPLRSLSENIYFEQQLRIEDKKQPLRYSAFGLRFSKPFIYNRGGRPVIYENTQIAKSFLPTNEHWRIVKLDLSDSENFVDWTHEREWRVKGYLEFQWKDVEILLSQEHDFQKFMNLCKKHGIEDLLNEIKGIITLKSVLF